MPTTLIDANTQIDLQSSNNCLQVSELFVDTLQGEGHYAGTPAAFLRLQGCPLGCTWCDTAKIWTKGHSFSFSNIFSLLEKEDTIGKLRNTESYHLVITGGSPLRQKDKLVHFIEAFKQIYGFKPFIEIENECFYFPDELATYVDCWNNSPKLSNSGLAKEKRYNSKVIQCMSLLKNSWFKFVVSDGADIKEIFSDYIDLGLIKHSQVILMPQGATKEELEKNRLTVAELAMSYGFKFCDRLQVTLYDTKTGV